MVIHGFPISLVSRTGRTKDIGNLHDLQKISEQTSFRVNSIDSGVQLKFVQLSFSHLSFVRPNTQFVNQWSAYIVCNLIFE